MTLKGALQDDSLPLSRGYVHLLPETATAGRAVIYIDWSSHEPSVGYSEESMVSPKMAFDEMDTHRIIPRNNSPDLHTVYCILLRSIGSFGS